MTRFRFKDAGLHGSIADLVKGSDHRTLALWASDCAERVLHCFEDERPGDDRPRQAIEACREWARTGMLKMADVRRVALAAHSAAREAEEGGAARFAARAVGHALATAHVPAHSIAAATYAAKAVWAADPRNAGDSIAKERDWQYHRLLELEAVPNGRRCGQE